MPDFLMKVPVRLIWFPDVGLMVSGVHGVGMLRSMNLAVLGTGNAVALPKGVIVSLSWWEQSLRTLIIP